MIFLRNICAEHVVLSWLCDTISRAITQRCLHSPSVQQAHWRSYHQDKLVEIVAYFSIPTAKDFNVVRILNNWNLYCFLEGQCSTCKVRGINVAYLLCYLHQSCRLQFNIDMGNIMSEVSILDGRNQSGLKLVHFVGL